MTGAVKYVYAKICGAAKGAEKKGYLDKLLLHRARSFHGIYS